MLIKITRVYEWFNIIFFGPKREPRRVSNCIFLNTENCLIFASAEGEDSERMRGCGGERE